MKNKWISMLVCGMLACSSLFFSGCKQEEEKIEKETVKEEEEIKDIEIVDYSSACLDENKNSIWFLVELKNPNGMYEFDSSKVILTLYDEEDREIGSVVDFLANVTPDETVYWTTKAQTNNGEAVDHFNFKVESHKHKSKTSNHTSYVEDVTLTNIDEFDDEGYDKVIFATLTNEGKNDFYSIDVIFAFYNEEGKVVYADKTTTGNVLPDGQEEIEITLPENMPEYDHFETYVHGVLK